MRFQRRIFETRLTFSLWKERAVSSERDRRAEEYRTKAQQARDKADAMLSDSARRTMLRAAEMWEALAASSDRPAESK